MSTLSVTNIKHASAASNNIALDSSGNATFAGTVVTPSINSGPLAGFRNAIINGNFDIWQRGTSFSNPASGAYTADRWVPGYNGSGATRTLDRQTFTLGQTDVPGEPTYFFRYNQSVAGTGGTISNLQQRVESVRTFAGQQITLSFYAKASSSITLPSVTYTQYFGTGGSPSTSVNTTASSNISVGTSWAKYSYTATLPSISGKTLGSDNNDYLNLVIELPLNTTFTLDLAQVQLEAGPVATPFERRPIGTELALCQRYYEKSDGEQGSGFFFSGNVTNGQTYYAVKGFAVQKRAAPVVAFSSTVVSGFPSVAAVSEIDKFGFRASAIANTTGSGGFFLGQWTASAEL